MFNKLLIANRGEIACRIMRTATRLGLRTVAVYSAADRDALHVEMADEAYAIGAAPARESYLVAERILDVARTHDCDAIHPGYGFLSENADFADLCAQAGVCFVGPSSDAIRQMGLKSEALSLMQNAGVPVLPGYRGAEQSDAALLAAAKDVGFPLMLKPSAGGGGKGMRVVQDAASLPQAIQSARREAKGAFGDDVLLLERFLDRAKHIEVQIFADRHGNVVHLYERDCSAQRRQQKVIEEAPGPRVTTQLRNDMTAAAITAARHIDYCGAGTVEFLLEDNSDSFYFLEMNTRLQVEHPVTEAVLGLDLVEWQLRVAAGEPLPLAQEQIRAHGHAFEARIYAEDPSKNFLPASGQLRLLRTPRGDSGSVRVDTGFREGDRIGIDYDPMIAKLITHGDTRKAALATLKRALSTYYVADLPTNISFLRTLATSERFATGNYDIGFIERELSNATRPHASHDYVTIALAAVAILEQAGSRTDNTALPVRAWRLNQPAREKLLFTIDGTDHEVLITHRLDGYVIQAGDAPMNASARHGADGALHVTLDQTRIDVLTFQSGETITLFVRGERFTLIPHDPNTRTPSQHLAGGGLTAPMPGKVISLLVEAQETVTRGQSLLVLEAMKMEHTITAPTAGTVEALHYKPGDLVEEGAKLVTLTETSD